MMLVENKSFRWLLPCVLACFLTIGCQKKSEEQPSPLSAENPEASATPEPAEVETSELVLYYDNKPLPQSVLDAFTQQHSLKVTQKKIEDNNVNDGDVFVISPATFVEFSKDMEFSDWTNPQEFPSFHPALMHHTFDGVNAKTLPLMWSPYVFYTQKAEQAKNPWNQWLEFKPAVLVNDMVLLTKYRLKEVEGSANRATQTKFTEVKNEVSGKIVAENLKTADDSWAAVQSGESKLAYLPLSYLVLNPTLEATLAFHLPPKGTLIDFPQVTIRKASRHQEKSKLLANFLVSKDIQAELAKETGYFSAVVADKHKDPWEGTAIVLPKGKWFSNSEYNLPVEKDHAPLPPVTEPAPVEEAEPNAGPTTNAPAGG